MLWQYHKKLGEIRGGETSARGGISPLSPPSVSIPERCGVVFIGDVAAPIADITMPTMLHFEAKVVGLLLHKHMGW